MSNDTVTQLTENSALLTDLYQLTMAHNYWKLGQTKRRACCQMFFRRPAFAGRYTIAAGLSAAIDYIKDWHFTSSDLDYLATLKWPSGKARFESGFIKYLENMRFSGTLSAVAEGSLIFPQQPLLRIEASIIQAQLLETALMNAYSLATLVTTKAHRVTTAAKGAAVSEFGLRRAQGPNGGLTASRAAYLGGVNSTSNVLAGKLYDIPVLGTLSHSWIMSFPDEQLAFDLAAECMGDATVLLVDTYNTAEGVEKAINTAKKLQQKGQQLAAIRLDSGDLAKLSIYAREKLNQAGLENTKIMASGNIDENVIISLQEQNAAIDAWGVGTKLSTADGQSALDIAYKLSSIEDDTGRWCYCYKKSDTIAKQSLAGRVQVYRKANDKQWQGDILYEQSIGLEQSNKENEGYNLLQPIIVNGELGYQTPSLQQSRSFIDQQFNAWKEWLQKDTTYPVTLDEELKKINSHLEANKK
jgi:nicotinate phosphoribosyltransferase